MYVEILLLTVAIFCIFAVSYKIGFLIIIGMASALLVRFLPYRKISVIIVRSIPKKNTGSSFVIVLIISVIMCVYLWFNHNALYKMKDSPDLYYNVQKHGIDIKLQKENNFIIQENAILLLNNSKSALKDDKQDTKIIDEENKKRVINLSPRKESSYKVGFLINEINIKLSINSSYIYKKVCQPKICDKSGTDEINIKLIDFPKESFYQAKYSTNIEKEKYLNTETITWLLKYPDEGIIFAYIIPPFNNLRAILNPFIGISNIGQWILVLIAFLTTFFFIPIVKPVLTDIAREKISSFVKSEQSSESKSKKKITLYTSSKGDTKEIDADE